MLGSRTARKLSGCAAGAALESALARRTGRPAIENGASPLDTCTGAGGGGSGGGRDHGRLVDRPGTGLRHHHAARRSGGRGRRFGLSLFGSWLGLDRGGWFGRDVGLGGWFNFQRGRRWDFCRSRRDWFGGGRGHYSDWRCGGFCWRRGRKRNGVSGRRNCGRDS